MKNESLEDWAKRPKTTSEAIKGYALLVLLSALYFFILSSATLISIFGTAIVLFVFGVIPFPRSTECKLKDQQELKEKIAELQPLYTVEMHPDWPYSQSDWHTARERGIEERARREIESERRENASFPYNLPWWGRVLCCVPWLVSGWLILGDRMWGWPIWR